MAHDLRPWIDAVEQIVANHQIEPGAYRRWNAEKAGISDNNAAPRDLGINEYGCADAANLLYTIGRFPTAPTERAHWIKALQALQRDDGLFVEKTHHPIHTTAHCLAALELFDATTKRPVNALQEYIEPGALETFLDHLDWQKNPWQQSHQGAGLYVALVLTNAADLAWQDHYFDWLWQEADPATGFWRKGCVLNVPHGNPAKGGIATLFPHLAGSFHYLFNCEYARRPLRYPAQMVDSCLHIRERDPFRLGKSIGFAEIDWVYCLTRALRQSGHRFAEAQIALRDFAAQYCTYLLALDTATHDGMNDLHALFGAACCVAELQTALPGEIRTARPLKLVLDRRPFI